MKYQDNQSPKPSPAHSGHTLVEATMGAVVAGFMITSLYAGFTCGRDAMQTAREDLRATQILQQKTEALRLCPWSALANLPVSFVATYHPAAAGDAPATRGTVYTGTITTNVASSIPDSAAYKGNMCLAIITVYWTNHLGNQTVVRSRQMQTQIARYGLRNYLCGTP